MASGRRTEAARTNIVPATAAAVATVPQNLAAIRVRCFPVWARALDLLGIAVRTVADTARRNLVPVTRLPLTTLLSTAPPAPANP